MSYEVLAKAKQLYREDYLLYERLRRMDVGAGAGIIAIAASSARRRLMYTQVETVVRGESRVVGTIYSD